jgi:hypothetical protein
VSENYKIFFWRYDRASKGYRGFHLSADNNGCDALLAGLRKKIRKPSDRTAKFNLCEPTERVLSAPNYRTRAQTWKLLEIRVDHNVPERFLNVTAENDLAHVSLSKDMAESMEKGVQDILEGNGDWSISSELKNADRQPIWFWWYLDK